MVETQSKTARRARPAERPAQRHFGQEQAQVRIDETQVCATEGAPRSLMSEFRTDQPIFFEPTDQRR
jgi:hypothetical protein